MIILIPDQRTLNYFERRRKTARLMTQQRPFITLVTQPKEILLCKNNNSITKDSMRQVQSNVKILVGEGNLIPEKLNTITSYGQFLFPSSGPHESISEYDILKYEMFMKENDESVKSSDSDNEIDPHHIYSDNPLYTGKRKIPKILNIAKELPKFESTPQPTEKQALLTKIKTKLVDLPINNTYNSDMKPKCFNTKPLYLDIWEVCVEPMCTYPQKHKPS